MAAAAETCGFCTPTGIVTGADTRLPGAPLVTVTEAIVPCCEASVTPMQVRVWALTSVVCTAVPPIEMVAPAVKFEPSTVSE